jgi:hypothetical protein
MAGGRTPAPPRSCAWHKEARRAAGGRFSSPALAPRHMGQGGAELELPRPQLPQAVLDGRQPARRLHRGRARDTGRPPRHRSLQRPTPSNAQL